MQQCMSVNIQPARALVLGRALAIVCLQFSFALLLARANIAKSLSFTHVTSMSATLTTTRQLQLTTNLDQRMNVS